MSKKEKRVSRRALIAGGAAIGAMGLIAGCRARPRRGQGTPRLFPGGSRTASAIQLPGPPRFRKIRVDNNSTRSNVKEVHVTHVVRAYGQQDRPVFAGPPQLSDIEMGADPVEYYNNSYNGIQQYVENVRFHLIMELEDNMLDYGYMDHDGNGDAPLVASYVTELYIEIEDEGDDYRVTASGSHSGDGPGTYGEFWKLFPA